jgi:hypothetical protein
MLEFVAAGAVGWEPGGNETRPLVSPRVLSCHLDNPLRAWNSALERAFRADRPSAYGTEGRRFESCRAR